MASRDDFLAQIMPVLQQATAGTNVDPTIAAAQVVQEGGYNTDRPGNNLSNITAGSNWEGPVINRGDTNRAGQAIKQNFRAYPNTRAWADDYVRLLSSNKRYAGVLQGTPEERIKALGASGYAEDPTYGDKVGAIAAKFRGAVPGVLASQGTPAAPAPTGADLTRYLVAGKDPSILKGVSDNLSSRFSTMIASAPPEIQKQLSILSAYRDNAHQARLWEGALKKYGSPEAARKWVAPPGKSQHGHGNAFDLRYADPAAREWAHANADKYGLKFPLSNEPWHIETAEARGGAAPSSPTTGAAPAGVMTAQGEAPASPAAAIATGNDAFNTALASFQQGQQAEAAKAMQQQQAAASAPPVQSAGPGAIPGGEGGAADLMASLIAKKRAQRLPAAPQGLLSAWT